MIRKIITLVLGIFLFYNFLISIDIEKKGEILLNQKNVIIQRAMRFLSIKNERFFLLDWKAKNIKIYDKTGEFVSLWKKQGYGPDEFGKPLVIEYRSPYLAVLDVGQRKFFFYSDKNNPEFSLIKQTFSVWSAEDLKIDGKRILVSGKYTEKNGKLYTLYLMDIESGSNIDLILPIEDKYGFKSMAEYEKKSDSIRALLEAGYCDILGNTAYYVWTSNLKIIQVDIQTKKKWIFGNQTKNYKKPIQTKKMEELYDSQSNDDYKEDRKFSYVEGIIADKEFVALIYANYSDTQSAWVYFIQFYSHDGSFLEERMIPGAFFSDYFPLKCYYYDYKDNILYFLSLTTDKDLENNYVIKKYSIR